MRSKIPVFATYMTMYMGAYRTPSMIGTTLLDTVGEFCCLLSHSARIPCTHSSYQTQRSILSKSTRHTAASLTSELSSSTLNKCLSLIISFLFPLLPAPNTTRFIRKDSAFRASGKCGTMNLALLRLRLRHRNFSFFLAWQSGQIRASSCSQDSLDEQ